MKRTAYSFLEFKDQKDFLLSPLTNNFQFYFIVDDMITNPLSSSGILLSTVVSLDFVYLIGMQIIDMTQM